MQKLRIYLYDFSSILILFRQKNFYIDNIIEKVVCVGFYPYSFDFITHFLFILLKRNFFEFIICEMNLQ